MARIGSRNAARVRVGDGDHRDGAGKPYSLRGRKSGLRKMPTITNCYFGAARTSEIASRKMRSTSLASITPSDFFSCRLFNDGAELTLQNGPKMDFLKSRFAMMRLRRGETRRRLFDIMEREQ